MEVKINKSCFHLLKNFTVDKFAVLEQIGPKRESRANYAETVIFDCNIYTISMVTYGI